MPNCKLPLDGTRNLALRVRTCHHRCFVYTRACLRLRPTYSQRSVRFGSVSMFNPLCCVLRLFGGDDHHTITQLASCVLLCTAIDTRLRRCTSNALLEYRYSSLSRYMYLVLVCLNIMATNPESSTFAQQQHRTRNGVDYYYGRRHHHFHQAWRVLRRRHH